MKIPHNSKIFKPLYHPEKQKKTAILLKNRKKIKLKKGVVSKQGNPCIK